MGVPTQRKTKSRRNKRRMHIFLKGPVLVPCPKCGKPVRPHRPHMVCSNWGKMGSTLFFIFYTIVDFLP